MKTRFAAPVASAATAIMLLGGCSDDGPTNLAQGKDVELVGDSDLAGETLTINAEEEDGEVTGEIGHRRRDHARVCGHRHRWRRHPRRQGHR